MKTVYLFALLLGTALGQASLYTYVQPAPGQPWQWGRLVLPGNASVVPTTGSPCNGPEPCYAIQFQAVPALPPGTSCTQPASTLLAKIGGACYPVIVSSPTDTYFVVLDGTGITYSPSGWKLSGIVVP